MRNIAPQFQKVYIQNNFLLSVIFGESCFFFLCIIVILKKPICELFRGQLPLCQNVYRVVCISALCNSSSQLKLRSWRKHYICALACRFVFTERMEGQTGFSKAHLDHDIAAEDKMNWNTFSTSRTTAKAPNQIFGNALWILVLSWDVCSRLSLKKTWLLSLCSAIFANMMKLRFVRDSHVMLKRTILPTAKRFRAAKTITVCAPGPLKKKSHLFSTLPGWKIAGLILMRGTNSPWLLLPPKLFLCYLQPCVAVKWTNHRHLPSNWINSQFWYKI